MPSFRFRREEKLKSRKVIEGLFKQDRRRSVGQYPLRLIWAPVEEKRGDSPVLFTVSVPKRRYKTAVLRNRLRRQVREAWRLHKHKLYESLPAGTTQYAWMVLYTGETPLNYAVIDGAMQKMIRKFLTTLSSTKEGD